MKATVTAFFTLTLLSLSIQSLAGGYMGAMIGISQLHDGGHLDGFELDRNGVSGGLYGGYQFNPYVALEGSARWLGIYTSDVSEARFASMTISALGLLPFADTGLDGYLQLGFGAALVSDAVQATEDNPNLGNVADTDPTVFGGLGIRYTPKKQRDVTLRLGYEYYVFEMTYPTFDYDDEGNLVIGDGEEFLQSIGNMTFAVQYNF